MYRKRIVIDDADVVVHSDDYYAPVLYWRCTAFHLEPNNDFVAHDQRTSSKSAAFVRGVQKNVGIETIIDLNSVEADIVHDDEWIAFKRLRCSADSLCAQISNIFAFVDHQLSAVKMSRSNVRFVALWLHHMSQYAQLNDVYNALFDTDPPARSCVADAKQVRDGGVEIDVFASFENADTLHVQSVSEWAPACIGPYSQATRVAEACLLAGQIALSPALMTLDDSVDVTGQFAQAERNCSAVAQLIDSGIDESNVMTAVRRALVFFDAAFVSEAEMQQLIDTRPWSHCASLYAVTGLPKSALVELQWLVVHSGVTFEKLTANRAFDCFCR